MRKSSELSDSFKEQNRNDEDQVSPGVFRAEVEIGVGISFAPKVKIGEEGVNDKVKETPGHHLKLRKNGSLSRKGSP